MSQEFDIYRELWDFCDDNSRRIDTLHDIVEDEPKEGGILDNPDEIINLMEHLDNVEQKGKKKINIQTIKEESKKEQKLDTPEDIFQYMCQNKRK